MTLSFVPLSFHHRHGYHLPLSAAHQTAEKTGRLGLRRILNAVDLDLGLAGAPLVLGNAGEDGRDVGAAATPRLLSCWRMLVHNDEQFGISSVDWGCSSKRWRG